MRLTRLILGVALMFCAAPAQAAPLTFVYTGTVTSVPVIDPLNPFPALPVPGATFSGTYTFDSLTSDAVPADPATGSYESSSGSSLTLDLGGLAFVYDSVAIGVTDGYGSFGFGQDQYLVGFADADTVLSLRFTDFTEAMFASDALPLVPPSLPGLFSEFSLIDIVDGNQVEIQGTITSLTRAVTPVPEPAMLLLLAAGASAIAMRRRARLIR